MKKLQFLSPRFVYRFLLSLIIVLIVGGGLIFYTSELALLSQEQEGTATSITSALVPSPPTLLTPVNDANFIATQTTFSWQSAAGATGYDLQIATDVSFEEIVHTIVGIAGTTHTLSHNQMLQQETTYYWRVRTHDATGTSNYSAAFDFHTFVPNFADDSLTDLALWLDAGDIDGNSDADVITDGLPIGTWADKSGNGYTATVSTLDNQPTYVQDGLAGQGALRFDGADDCVGQVFRVAALTQRLAVR